MKPNKLSLWAKSNPRKAQICITIGHIVSILLSIELGILALTLGIIFPNWLIFLLAEVFIAVSCLYPVRKEHATSQVFHQKRRYFDAILLTLGIFITIICANRATSLALDAAADISEQGHINVSPLSSYTKFVVYQDTKPTFKTPNHSQQKSSVKAWLQRKVAQKYHNAEPIDTPDKAIVMIILVLLTVLVEAGLAYLSCWLACNGMNGLAVLLIFGGLFGLGALISHILRSIYPDMPKKERINTAVAMVTIIPFIAFLATRVLGG